MKIVFICGSLEPGKDGVGDYTRKLASELIRRGNCVAAIAFYDRHIDEISITEQKEEGGFVSVLRLGVEQSVNNKIILIKQWLKEWDPDWVSLQFVPYAYHDKGLPWRLGGQLARIVEGKKWHIMYHELWVEGTDIKSRILSKLQQLIIAETNKKLSPVLTHTHLPVYKKRLKGVDIYSKKLPVFSNINGIAEEKSNRNKFLTIAFFSQLTVRDSVLSFLKDFLEDISSFEYNFQILILGGSNGAKTKLKETLELLPILENKVHVKEFLPENELFKVINTCDMGITPIPRHVLGKSGSVAAFLSQGIPVAAPYAKVGYEHLKIGFLKKKLKEGIFVVPDLPHFQKAKLAAKRIPQKISVNAIANKFVKDLAEISL